MMRNYPRNESSGSYEGGSENDAQEERDGSE